MKIRYEFLTGEHVEIEVPESISEISVAIDRDIYNSDRRETRRHNSLNGMQENGCQPVDPNSEVAAAVEEIEAREALHKALDKLLPRQRELIQKIFFEDMSIVQVARDEGVGESAIRDRLNRIYKKIKNHLT